MVVVNNPSITGTRNGAFPAEEIGFAEISSLPIDHPGAHDPHYRLRRNYIASLAQQFRADPQP